MVTHFSVWFGTFGLKASWLQKIRRFLAFNSPVVGQTCSQNVFIEVKAHRNSIKFICMYFSLTFSTFSEFLTNTALIKTEPKCGGCWHINFQGSCYHFGHWTVFFGFPKVQAVILVQFCHFYTLVILDKPEIVQYITIKLFSLPFLCFQLIAYSHLTWRYRVYEFVCVCIHMIHAFNYDFFLNEECTLYYPPKAFLTLKKQATNEQILKLIFRIFSKLCFLCIAFNHM